MLDLNRRPAGRGPAWVSSALKGAAVVTVKLRLFTRMGVCSRPHPGLPGSLHPQPEQMGPIVPVGCPGSSAVFRQNKNGFRRHLGNILVSQGLTVKSETTSREN